MFLAVPAAVAAVAVVAAVEAVALEVAVGVAFVFIFGIRHISDDRLEFLACLFGAETRHYDFEIPAEGIPRNDQNDISPSFLTKFVDWIISTQLVRVVFLQLLS